MSADSPQDKQAVSDNQPAKKPSKSRIWLRRGIEVVLIIIVIMAVRTWQQRDIVKGAAAPLSGKLLDGKSYQLPHNPAQPVLVHFWATWCPICRAEEGSIEALASSNPNVITIAMQSGSDAEVQQFMREQKLTFPVINDTLGRLSSAWGVKGVPASFIVGTDGEIKFVEIGYTTGIGLRIRLWLAGLQGCLNI
jgi:thiol-disulfide isomerase/thioredoxin